MSDGPTSPVGLTTGVRRWYRRHGRSLPWREPGTTPWQVLVSEVMLAQTPVARVEPAYREWIARWPDAESTAGASTADLIRAWGRLGYPRRALRLREAAGAVVEQHGGAVPDEWDALIALPGVGEYTASAVLAFAYGRRVAVLDTNVRRVLARVILGEERAPTSLTRPERDMAKGLLPRTHAAAAEWSVAVMELGALVCTAKRPRCEECPVRDGCAWLLSGRPAGEGPPRRQAWHGTDRQCRGTLMAVLRASADPVGAAALARAWPEDQQRERCLQALLDDGLISRERGRYRLPA